jgi:hypothetical protein
MCCLCLQKTETEEARAEAQETQTQIQIHTPAPTPALPHLSFEKVEDDPGFEVIVDSYGLEDGDLVVRFRHTSNVSQPVWVEGIGAEVNYSLSRGVLPPGEEGVLRVYGWHGEAFDLHVGQGSEVIRFGGTQPQAPAMTLKTQVVFSGKAVDKGYSGGYDPRGDLRPLLLYHDGYNWTYVKYYLPGWTGFSVRCQTVGSQLWDTWTHGVGVLDGYIKRYSWYPLYVYEDTHWPCSVFGETVGWFTVDRDAAKDKLYVEAYWEEGVPAGWYAMCMEGCDLSYAPIRVGDRRYVHEKPYNYFDVIYYVPTALWYGVHRIPYVGSNGSEFIRERVIDELEEIRVRVEGPEDRYSDVYITRDSPMRFDFKTASNSTLVGSEGKFSTSDYNFSIYRAKGIVLRAYDIKDSPMRINGSESLILDDCYMNDTRSCFKSLGFTPENSPPPTPVLRSPPDGSILSKVSHLAVYPVVDPDGDPITYLFYLDQENASTLYASSTLPYTEVNLSGGAYHWRVEASDGQYTASSETWSFILDPLPPVLLGRSSDPPSPTTPVDRYVFTSNWTDNLEVDSVWLEVDGGIYPAAYSSSGYQAALLGSELPLGVYNVRWLANDTAGNLGSSPVEKYAVVEYSISLSIDKNVTPPGKILLSGTARRSDGYIPPAVDILDNGTLVASLAPGVDGSIYTFLDLEEPGVHLIEASTTDPDGIQGRSRTLEVLVRDLEINISLSDYVVMPVEPFTVIGVARYSDGTYPPWVEVYVDNASLGRVNVSSDGGFSKSILIGDVGVHSVRAGFVDEYGIGASDTELVTVKTLTITSNLSAFSILHFQSITLTGYAYYSDGTHPPWVEVYIDGSHVAGVQVFDFGFYSYTIGNQSVGDHVVVVKYRDSDGIIGSSPPLSFHVGDNPPGQNTNIVVESKTLVENETVVFHDPEPTLSWDTGVDPDGDVVYTHINVSARYPGGGDVLSVVTAGDNYTLPRLDFETTYYIRMWTSSGTGLASEPFDFMIQVENSPPSSPVFESLETYDPEPTLSWVEGVDPDGDPVNTLLEVDGIKAEVSGDSYTLRGLEAGSYNVTLWSKDSYGALSDPVSGLLTVLVPSVRLLYPIGGEQLSSTAVLRANITGDIGRVVFYYSPDQGATWVQIGESLSRSNPYTILWETTLVENGAYLAKVMLLDPYGGRYEDVSGEFYVQNTPLALGGKTYQRIIGGYGGYAYAPPGASPMVSLLTLIIVFGIALSAGSLLAEYIRMPEYAPVSERLQSLDKDNIMILGFLSLLLAILHVGYGVLGLTTLLLMFQDIYLVVVVAVFITGLWYFRGRKPKSKHRPRLRPRPPVYRY